jgi:hypothetical protein
MSGPDPNRWEHLEELIDRRLAEIDRRIDALEEKLLRLERDHEELYHRLDRLEER